MLVMLSLLIIFSMFLMGCTTPGEGKAVAGQAIDNLNYVSCLDMDGSNSFTPGYVFYEYLDSLTGKKIKVVSMDKKARDSPNTVIEKTCVGTKPTNVSIPCAAGLLNTTLIIPEYMSMTLLSEKSRTKMAYYCKGTCTDTDGISRIGQLYSNYIYVYGKVTLNGTESFMGGDRCYSNTILEEETCYNAGTKGDSALATFFDCAEKGELCANFTAAGPACTNTTVGS